MNSNASSNSRWIIGITGASGTIYARRLVSALILGVPDVQLEVVISDAAFRVFQEEDNIFLSTRTASAESLLGFSSSQIRFHNNRDIGASIASGSFECGGMVIVPCSMTTLSAVSLGYSDNLIRRAADVTLKERRSLIVVPRETPVTELHLEHMLALTRRGARMVPAMPGFYSQPRSINDLADLLVMRIADQMGYRLDLVPRWPNDLEDAPAPSKARAHLS